MFELRWAERDTGKTLEFRARYNTPFPGSHVTTEWSEWTIVPTEYFLNEDNNKCTN